MRKCVISRFSRLLWELARAKPHKLLAANKKQGSGLFRDPVVFFQALLRKP
jgi:hypothetical protein